MSWAAVAGAVIGAGAQYYGAKQAAGAQVKGGNAAIDEQRRQFDLIMGMLGPQQGLGTNAINTLNRLYGYAPTTPGGGTSYTNGLVAPTPPAGYGSAPKSRTDITGTTDAINSVRSLFGFGGSKKKNKKKAAAAAAKYEADLAAYNQAQQAAQAKYLADEAAKPQGLDAFTSSPDYEFRRAEGNRDINNSFAARGGALSGNALRGITDYNSNLASGEFNNFVQRQLQMAGLGGQATSQGVNAAQYTGGNVSNILGQQGNARASGILGQADAFTGGINAGFDNYLTGRALRKKPLPVSNWNAGLNAGYS